MEFLNRMSRATLGGLKSTPVAFLEAEGGSMPSLARLDKRQEAYAAWVATSGYASTRQLLAGTTPLAVRLRGSAGMTMKDSGRVERGVPTEGIRFPGEI